MSDIAPRGALAPWPRLPATFTRRWSDGTQAAWRRLIQAGAEMPTKTLAAAPSVAASGAVGRALAAGLGCRALSCAPGTPAPRHQRARLPETARRALWGRSTPVIAAPREARVPLPRGPDVPVRSLPLPTWVDAMPARYQPYLRLARADNPSAPGCCCGRAAGALRWWHLQRGCPTCSCSPNLRWAPWSCVVRGAPSTTCGTATLTAR